MRLGVTNHAVTRYIERVKPAFDFEVAKAELLAFVNAVEPAPEPPQWVRAVEPDTTAFIEISDGIVAMIKDDSVTTVLTRSGHSPEARVAINAAKRKRRAARRWRSGLQGTRGKGFGEWAA